LTRFGTYVPPSSTQVPKHGQLVEAIEQKQAYPQQEPIHAAMHVRFKRLVGFNKDNWPHEYENWHAKGWL
jgi:hypothetical protein